MITKIKIDRMMDFWFTMSNIRNIEFVGVYDIQTQIIERVELLQADKNEDKLY